MTQTLEQLKKEMSVALSQGGLLSLENLVHGYLKDAYDLGKQVAVSFIRENMVPINKDIGSYAIKEDLLQAAVGEKEEEDKWYYPKV